MSALVSNQRVEAEEESYETDYPRVLSVQSHVVSGYVGNRAAVFPLQILGFDADCINSVQFSNHTQYPAVKGQVMQGHELLDLVDGLKGNNLVDYDYLVTGYIGSESFLSSVLDVLSTIQSANPGVKYVCDPVLGDEGVCYVPSVLVDIYKSRVIPLAYMITPNQFEAELLTGIKIIDEQSAVAAMICLFDLGPTVVVLSSAEFPDVNPGKLFCYTLMRDKNEPDKYNISRVIVNKMDGKYTGTGDCTTVLMLAWMHRTNEDTSSSLLNSISTVQGILSKTRERMLRTGVVAGQGTPRSSTVPMDEEARLKKMKLMRYSELCIIPGKRCIEFPPIEKLGISVVEWQIQPSCPHSYTFKD